MTILKDINVKYEYTTLHWVAKEGTVKIMRILIGWGINLDTKDRKGRTALHVAAEWGREDIVKELIENGANVNIVDKNEETALHAAARRGFVKIATILIENGINVDRMNKNDKTATDIAIQYRQNQIAGLIEDFIKKRNALDILNTDMDELVRRADESAKRLCRRE